MKIVASLICRNEMQRYLRLVVPHLLEFVDEIRVVDDASDDGTGEWLETFDREGRIKVHRNTVPEFQENEGLARHRAFEWTLEGKPSHILAIDSDEFVSDGAKLRQAVEGDPEIPAWTLLVCEVWKADKDVLWLRRDSTWTLGRSPVLYRAPEAASNVWRIPPRKLASGREPTGVVQAFVRGEKIDLPVELLHFGWANESERHARYLRYAVADGGEFHSGPHIESIIAKEGVQLEAVAWPVALDRQKVLDCVNREL